ncbi:hypothetical protein ERN12_11850 [Rhodobacteraceae bacterium]|nr:hypothetical protein ERN12_11850 [Paracoccaceae bacterium]
MTDRVPIWTLTWDISFMFRALLLLCSAGLLWIFVTASSAQTGPWMRAPGQSFVSASTEIASSERNWTSIYAEYGVSARNTLTVELGSDLRHTEEFWLGWQVPLTPEKWQHRVSLTALLGARQSGSHRYPMYGVGLNWGRGFGAGVLPWGGWMSAEGRYLTMHESMIIDPYSIPGIDPMTLPDARHFPVTHFSKLDVTFGLHATEQTMLINQLRFYKPDNDDLSSRLATSVVHDMGLMDLELGATFPLKDEGDPRLMLGSWFEF